MKNKKLLKIAALTLAVGVCASFALTGLNSATASADSGVTASAAAPDSVSSATKSADGTGNLGTSTDGTPILNGNELFSARDLEQSPDLSEAVILSVSDGQTLSVSGEGVYVLRGTAKNATVVVEAEDSAKVQLVLDGLSISNDSFPCIYVKSADKVFITTVSDSSLSVTDGFVSDGDTRTDAVIFSRDDLVLNGSAVLTISSACNGVSCKDDLKLTGGSYVVTAASKCFEANDSIRVAGGSYTLSAGTDGLHAENDEDDSLGYIYIGGGQFSIRAGDDGIHAKAFVQIDGGSFTIIAAEGIEATAVQLNDGSISIESWDDGINAARKSTAYAVCVEINGGEINIVMGAGDTDGIDSNGSLIVNGGTVNITGSSGFDYEGSASYNGGTLILNGQTLDSIPNQMMGGAGGMGGMGGMGGQPGGMGGRGRRG